MDRLLLTFSIELGSATACSVPLYLIHLGMETFISSDPLYYMMIRRRNNKSMDIWIHGYMDIWICMDIRIYGHSPHPIICEGLCPSDSLDLLDIPPLDSVADTCEAAVQLAGYHACFRSHRATDTIVHRSHRSTGRSMTQSRFVFDCVCGFHLFLVERPNMCGPKINQRFINPSE